MSPLPVDRSLSELLRHHGQHGAAVVSAMLLVAIVAASGTTMLLTVDNWIEQHTLTRDKAQTTELARSSLAYARQVLAADAQHSVSDTLNEDWARELPPLRFEDADIHGRISDVQGRFNLNNLRRENGVIDAQAYDAYLRLLAVLGLPPALADTLADWLDADDSRRAAGFETTDYLAAGEDISGIGRPLSTLGELRRVRGYTAAVMARLGDHVYVLAGRQATNLNTASPEVLSALQPGLSLAEAKALSDTRRSLPFRDEADFRTRLGAPSLPASLLPVGVSSKHFLIQIDVSRGRSRSRIVSLVHRQDAAPLPQILWQTIQ